MAGSSWRHSTSAPVRRRGGARSRCGMLGAVHRPRGGGDRGDAPRGLRRAGSDRALPQRHARRPGRRSTATLVRPAGARPVSRGGAAPRLRRHRGAVLPLGALARRARLRRPRRGQLRPAGRQGRTAGRARTSRRSPRASTTRSARCGICSRSPFVRADRVAAIGWSQGGVYAMAVINGPSLERARAARASRCPPRRLRGGHRRVPGRLLVAGQGAGGPAAAGAHRRRPTTGRRRRRAARWSRRCAARGADATHRRLPGRLPLLRRGGAAARGAAEVENEQPSRRAASAPPSRTRRRRRPTPSGRSRSSWRGHLKWRAAALYAASPLHGSRPRVLA